jgi:tRNA-specific 2-thiouridylase
LAHHIEHHADHAVLKKGRDARKDQSYFLFSLSQDQLQHALTPLGGMEKSEIREIARGIGLKVADTVDSQEICFVPGNDYKAFLKGHLGEGEFHPGSIYDTQGNFIAKHEGIEMFTIGQRKGIGEQLVPGVVNVGPWFVAAKDAASNTVYITNDLTLIDRPRKEFTVDSLNWIMGMPTGLEPGGAGLDLDIRLRHGPSLARGRVYATSNSEGGLASSCRVVLDRRDKGLAPGQFAAFYAPLPLDSDSPLDLQGGGVCLGAGVIAETARDELEL